MTRERLTFGHGAHVPVPRVAAATAATTAHEATPVHFSRPETWDWAWGGLLFFTVLLFFRPQDQIPFLRDSHLANVAALIGLAAMVGLNLSRRLPITRLTPELVALALFGLVIGITIPLSFWPGGAFNAFETLYIPVLLIFVLMVNTVTSPRRIERICWVIVLAFGYVSARAWFDYARGVNMVEGGRIAGAAGGFFENPNDLALNLASFLPLAMMYVKRRGPFLKRVASLGITVLMLGAIIFTKSRSGMLGTAAMMVVYLLVTRSLKPTTMIGLVMAGMLVLPILPDSFWYRMSSITDESKDTTGSAEQRWELMQKAWAVFLDHPLTGIGAGQFQNFAYPGEKRTWRVTHNAYLQIGAEIGILGLAAFIYLIVRAFRAAWWTRRELSWIYRRRSKKRPEIEPEDGLTDDERYYLQTHAAAMVACLVGWAVCAFFASVAFNWTFYYLLGLSVTARDVVRHRALAYREAKALAMSQAVA